MAETALRNRVILKLFLALRGAASLLFGCAVLVWAISDQGSLALSFCIYSFIDGLIALVFSFVLKDRGSWIFRAEGVVSLLAAVFTLAGPVAWSGVVSHTGSIFLPYFIIARYIVTGMFQILSVGFLEKPGWRPAIVPTGIAGVILGILLICLRPNTQTFTIALGVCGILIGFGLVVLRFLVRQGLKEPAAEPQSPD